MSELEHAREEIDRLDSKIIDAIAERMDVAGRVAQYKLEHDMPVLDAAREQAVIDDRKAQARSFGLPDGTEELFRTIIRMSRERQEQMLERYAAERSSEMPGAAYQGVPGANSHLALVQFLGEEAAAQNCDTFEDVFQAVESGEVMYGVLPIENSFAGSVTQVYDLLGRHDVHIAGERSVHVNHALMGLPGTRIEDIRTVYSHEQALEQCAGFLASHPGIEPRTYYNTAGAAKFVAGQKDSSVAAFANEHAARIYGLDILVPEAATSPDNTTRFILISARPYQGRDANKAALRFTLAHAPGSLAHALGHFASYGLNMIKIESRPVRDRSFEYAFYADFEGPDVGRILRRALDDDTTLLADSRILGVYRKQI